jgi:hypothetical protein
MRDFDWTTGEQCILCGRKLNPARMKTHVRQAPHLKRQAFTIRWYPMTTCRYESSVVPVLASFPDSKN